MEKNDGEFPCVLWGTFKMIMLKQRYQRSVSRASLRQAQGRLCPRCEGGTPSPRGFVLVLVIVAIIIIGIEMFVLAGMANTMQYQSHRAYLKACERNLLASGLVWARQNVQKIRGESPGHMIQLDVSEMDIPGSALEVSIGVTDDEPEVRIRTSCSRGRQTLRSGGTYKIERYDQPKTTPGTRQGPTGD